MYLLIPLALILASSAGVFVIVWRKRPYLEKLSAAETKPEAGIWSDLFPEFAEGFNGAKPKLKHYRGVWLLELEKFLRRLRVISMKMDRASDSWIKKIRKVTERKLPSSSNSLRPAASPPAVLEQTAPTIEGMKKEEQRMIIEIAKNPKNPVLYETLGDLYM